VSVWASCRPPQNTSSSGESDRRNSAPGSQHRDLPPEEGAHELRHPIGTGQPRVVSARNYVKLGVGNGAGSPLAGGGGPERVVFPPDELDGLLDPGQLALHERHLGPGPAQPERGVQELQPGGPAGRQALRGDYEVL
jgi:hypothetical protein